MASPHHLEKAAALQNSRITQHSRYVRIMKITITSVIFVCLATLIAWPFMNKTDDKYTLTFTEMEERSDDKAEPALINPRYYGIDNNENPYNVLADKAEEAPDSTVYFTTLNTDLYLKDGTWVAVIANKGQLEPNKRFLHLIGDVNISLESGYDIKTERALIDLKESGASGKERVFVQSGAGTIKADGFNLKERGDNIRFLGNVKTVKQEGLFDPKTMAQRKAEHKSRLSSKTEASTIERNSDTLSFASAVRPKIITLNNEAFDAPEELPVKSAVNDTETKGDVQPNTHPKEKPKAVKILSKTPKLPTKFMPKPHFKPASLYFSKIPIPVLKGKE